MNEKGNVREAVSTIEAGGVKIALVIDERNKLLGTICDGDIRRGLLRGLNLNSPITEIMKMDCIVASKNASHKETIKLMKENAIAQIPIVSENKELIGLKVLEEILPNEKFFYKI